MENLFTPIATLLIGIDMTDWNEYAAINSATRLGIRRPGWMSGDWFTSWSPRNDNHNAEGTWNEWVTLAEQILAHPATAYVRAGGVLDDEAAKELFGEDEWDNS